MQPNSVCASGVCSLRLQPIRLPWAQTAPRKGTCAMYAPKELMYSITHEWVKTDVNKAVIGLTDFAQAALDDIVFVSLPHVGEAVRCGQCFAEVESVKAVTEVYSPVDGVICAVNEALADAPATINSAPYQAWLIEVQPVDKIEDLLTAEEYTAICEIDME